MGLSDFFNNYGWIIIGYVIFLIFYGIFLLAAFYHAWEYGYAGDASKVVMFTFAGIGVIIVIFTFIFLFRY